MRGVFTAHQNPGAVLLSCRGHMGAGDSSCLKDGMKVISSRTEKHPRHELLLQALRTVFQPRAGEAACSQDMIWFSLISASIPRHPSFTLRDLLFEPSLFLLALPCSFSGCSSCDNFNEADLNEGG